MELLSRELEPPMPGVMMIMMLVVAVLKKDPKRDSRPLRDSRVGGNFIAPWELEEREQGRKRRGRKGRWGKDYDWNEQSREQEAPQACSGKRASCLEGGGIEERVQKEGEVKSSQRSQGGSRAFKAPEENRVLRCVKHSRKRGRRGYDCFCQRLP